LAVRLAARFEDKPKWAHWPLAERAGFERSLWAAALLSVSRVSSRLLEAVGASRARFGGRLAFNEAAYPTLAREHNLSVAWLSDRDARLLRCCDDVDASEEPRSGDVLHPFKGEKHFCQRADVNRKP
jgi:hypothetical protein